MPGPSQLDDPTVSSVTASITVVTLFAATDAVSSRHVFNESSALLYLKYGAGASATSYTTQVLPGQLYEFPDKVYTGLVTGLWTAANGAARCTEVS